MDFSLAQFEPLVGADFTVHTSHGPFVLKLAEASERPRRGLPEHLRTPLSLIFDGPAGVVLGHDNYLLAHPAIGQHVLNIVPVLPAPGRPPGRPQYQILFA
jgi:Ser/Thr protein kinase RdoA (MazF antagonist)